MSVAVGDPPDDSGKRRTKWWKLFVAFAGILLPVITVGVELRLRICTGLFDPIPTNWHIALLFIVPLANLTTLIVHNKGSWRYAALSVFLLGLSLGVCTIYSVQFLPMIPFATLAIIAYGIGLLPLSPHLALISTIICSRNLGRMGLIDQRNYRLAIWSGALISMLVLGFFISTSLLTKAGLRMAVSPDEDISRRGVAVIRSFGSDNVLLRTCYELPTGVWVGDLAFARGETRVTRDQARDVYYRVTGNSFNSVPAPKLTGPRSSYVDDFDFDSDVGGTAVNGIIKNLSMSSSRIDAVVDPDGLNAYTEWTLVFRNNSTDQREARAEIALPPGGVVSRLTLWVNGEEREAAFAGRGKVRQAYQQVAVVQRRDPVLVTTCGKDRVMMQCFPIPENGGSMKVRLGITSPLSLEDTSKAVFKLPKFIERNFRIDDSIKHSLFIRSERDEKPILKTISDKELLSPRNSMSFSRDSKILAAWTPDIRDPGHYAAVQGIGFLKQKTPDSIIVVIDGSKKLEPYRKEIADALDSLPNECRFSVIKAGDGVEVLAPLRPVSPITIKAAQERIPQMRFVGGIDNRAALLKAYESAGAKDNRAVLWIHGPQPLRQDSLAEGFLQVMQHSVNAPQIYALAVSDGRNTILADLEGSTDLNVIQRSGSISSDIGKLMDAWKKGSAGTPAVFTHRVPLDEARGKRSSSHIARLWAKNEVMRIISSGDSRQIPEAVKIAADYQLVTPVSGAVVLETKQQYKENDLNPVDPHSVPSVVPEPAGLVVLTLGAGSIITACRRRKR